MKISHTLFAALTAVCALLWAWRHFHCRTEPSPTRAMPPPAEMVPFRTAGGILHTNGFTQSETVRQETASWRGTTVSQIRFTATYRYEIPLRSKEWNMLIDDARQVAFVIAPPLRPQLPVAVDSRSVQDWTESGWGRFDKCDHLQTLRREISPHLERLAGSSGYLEVARGQARMTVEEFVSDWLLKNRGWPEHSERFVKVYFADEPDIPFPENKSLKDFLP